MAQFSAGRSHGDNGISNLLEVCFGIIDESEQFTEADAEHDDLIDSIINETGIEIIEINFMKLTGIETVLKCVGVTGLTTLFSGHGIGSESRTN